SGQLFFRNSNITTLRAEVYRQQVSYCFQTPQLFGQTVYDNLALPWQIRRQKPQRDKLVAALESVNLSGDVLNKPVEQLSGGEKQRVGLLRNLQFMPEVLLLDEVTSALDEENRLSVLSLINRIAAEEKVAVVRISHDVNDIQQAEQVLRLEPPEKENKRTPDR
ncbi:ATP-binding cassette domain-containing protein, partial [Pantoea agglomerans]|nr:ATP-binding cassette domain-containing protein [Pantoea agglomerans]